MVGKAQRRRRRLLAEQEASETDESTMRSWGGTVKVGYQRPTDADSGKNKCRLVDYSQSFCGMSAECATGEFFQTTIETPPGSDGTGSVSFEEPLSFESHKHSVKKGGVQIAEALAEKACALGKQLDKIKSLGVDL